MAAVKPIRAEEDYEAALERVSELMDTLSGPQGQIEDPNHPDRIELDVLTDLVQLYEARHYPIDPPTPIGAIEYEMDRRGLTPRDLIPIIGSRSKVSEILSGKREITMPMARALHQHLNIPAEILLRDPAADSDDPLSDMDPQKFPLKEMTKRGWIPKVPASEMKHYARELIQGTFGARRRAEHRPRSPVSQKRPSPHKRQDELIRAHRMVLADFGHGKQTRCRILLRTRIHNSRLSQAGRKAERVPKRPRSCPNIPRQARHTPYHTASPTQDTPGRRGLARRRRTPGHRSYSQV